MAAIAACFLGCACPGLAASLPPGQLQILVLEEDGAVTARSQAFIYSQTLNRFLAVHDVAGIGFVELPPGEYRVYAARIGEKDGTIDHFSSPVVYVKLSPGEPSSIILALRKSPDADIRLSEASQRKLGIRIDLTNALN